MWYLIAVLAGLAVFIYAVGKFLEALEKYEDE